MMAVVCLLEHVQGSTGKLATATDSKYVYDGVTWLAYRWLDMGWVNSQGPVANVDLCITLLCLIDDTTMSLRWVKVPSHTVLAMEGNHQADCLAEMG